GLVGPPVVIREAVVDLCQVIGVARLERLSNRAVERPAPRQRQALVPGPAGPAVGERAEGPPPPPSPRQGPRGAGRPPKRGRVPPPTRGGAGRGAPPVPRLPRSGGAAEAPRSIGRFARGGPPEWCRAPSAPPRYRRRRHPPRGRALPGRRDSPPPSR